MVDESVAKVVVFAGRLNKCTPTRIQSRYSCAPREDATPFCRGVRWSLRLVTKGPFSAISARYSSTCHSMLYRLVTRIM